MKLFNTLSGELETLTPIHGGEVRMYHCGPTVYDYAHIGNLRSYICMDILRRTIEYVGYAVKQVMNITDIDDKTLERSQKEKISLAELTKKYENIFLNDLNSLHIKIPEHILRATEHIDEMITLITTLLDTNYAYITEDGVYFSIAKSKGYGLLAHLDLNAITQSRITHDEYEKKDARDFALWKFETTEKDTFATPFGRGRPGWHIECSAMAMGALGEQIDIHTGGMDLIFPHHTNEIAQSEAATGKPFARFWLHNEFVMVDGQKMSKSLNNFFTLKTIIDRGIPPLAYRYWVLGTHYRAKSNFTEKGIEGAKNALHRLGSHIKKEIGTIDRGYQVRFKETILNDLDTPRALALAWEVAKDTMLSPADKTATLLDFDQVLGLGLYNYQLQSTQYTREKIPQEITTLLADRETARQNRDWAKSDKIREKINTLGFDIEDSPLGARIKKF